MLVNTLKLESISAAGSVGFLLIFTVVNDTGFKLSKEIGGKKSIPLLGAIFCFIAKVALLVQHYSVSKSRCVYSTRNYWILFCNGIHIQKNRDIKTPKIIDF